MRERGAPWAGIQISRTKIGMGLHCPVQRNVLDTRAESALQTKKRRPFALRP